jgi:hypothetical protein
MIQDILLAALGGQKSAGSILEAELEKLKKSGIPVDEVEAIAREARAAFEARARVAATTAAPLIDAAREALRGVLGVPSRQELTQLTERLERAVAALERAEARAREASPAAPPTAAPTAPSTAPSTPPAPGT